MFACVLRRHAYEVGEVPIYAIKVHDRVLVTTKERKLHGSLHFDRVKRVIGEGRRDRKTAGD